MTVDEVVHKVLLVDDDPFVRQVAEMQLRGLGYAVLCAHNAEQALSLLNSLVAEELPRHILSDDQMPGGMSGAAFLDEVKKTWPQLRCTLMSGSFTSSTEGQLMKPFTRKQLSAVLCDDTNGVR